jgi:PAS domain S-box-containing protein
MKYGEERDRGPGTAGLVLVFAALAAGILASGYVYYRGHERDYRAEVERQLSAIAGLKAGDLAHWRQERLGDAETIYRNPAFSELARRFLAEPGDVEARRSLQIWLDKFKTRPDYDRIFLLDTSAAIRLSAPEGSPLVVPHLAKNVTEVLSTGRIEFLDFHRDVPGGPIHLAMLVPLFEERDGQKPLGAVALRIDPGRYLYPLIRTWPTPSLTAETLLIRRDGTDALFLNELRFTKNSALNLRSPLTRVDQPAVRALLGRTGIVEGRDYRGVPVVADVRPVPDSPWFLVARMDLAEVDAPLRQWFWLTILIIAALLLAAAGGVGIIWRRQRMMFYRERSEAAETLRETSDYLENLINYANAPIIVWDPQFRVTRFNRAFESLTGRKAGVVIGRPVEQLFPAATAEGSMSFIRKTLTGERWETVEIDILHVDGRISTVLWNSATLFAPDGKTPVATIAQGQDITERKRAEESLALQVRIGDIFLNVPDDGMFNEVLKVVLEVMQSPFGVFGYLDENGDWVAPTMTRQVWDRCRVPEKAFFFPRAAWGNSTWPRAIREKRVIFSNRPSTDIPDGHVPISRHISLPIMLQGEVIGLFQVANKATDYTEEDIGSLASIADLVAPILSARLRRQWAQDSLSKSALELRKTNDELVRFTYTVSHDLKSPLVTIKAFLGFLEKDAGKADAQAMAKDLGFIHGAADKMTRLLDELLELSRVGRKMNPSVDVPLREVVQEALDLTAGQIAGRGVEIAVTGEPVVIHGDRARLVEVFQNLVDNAVKFMGDQAKPRVEIGVERAGDETVIFVRDNGIGVDPRFQSKLFDLFEKLDAGVEGSGIGLALVKRIVEVHGGWIRVESAGPGAGTTFRFTLAPARGGAGAP